jgi:C4-dicarboxylate-specific signal transduction histidine kinase
LFDGAAPARDQAARRAQATRTVSLLIRPNKFVPSDASAWDKIGILFYHKAFRPDDPNGMLYRSGPKPRTDPLSRLLPNFFRSIALPGRTQPFVLETRRQPGWELMNLPATAATAMATLLLALLSAALLNSRRRHADDARAADELLFRERERALVTLDSISDAVITLDARGMVEFMNPAAEAATGNSLGAAKGQEISRILKLEVQLSRTALDHPFQRCIEHKRTIELPENSVLVDAEGLRTPVEGSCSPLYNRTSSLIGAVVVWRDMGPVRRQAQATIEAGEKRLRQHQAELTHVARLNTMGEMASGIAHEINQPLAAILSYNQACVRMLQDGDADIGEMIAAMKASAAQSQRAADTITRLRAFVSKKATMSVAVDLNQVVKNTLVLAEHSLRDQHVQVQADLTATLPAVMADSIQLEQVVLNLIRNAIEAMRCVAPQERCIVISTSAEHGKVGISVRDRGPGIAPEDHGQLFDPFFTTKADGMGLGLSISRTIIETYGGFLVAGNLPDGGAVFSFALEALAQ